MPIILKDYEVNSYETTFGTCELCMSTGIVDEETFVFEDTETGQQMRIPNFEWSWGDFFPDMYPLKNIVNFGYFIKTRGIRDFDSFDFIDVYEEYKTRYEPITDRDGTRG